MVVIVRLKGGLGNQFFQYATGYVLAKKLNCKLKLDISFYAKQCLRGFELKDFDIDANIATQEESIKLGAPINVKNKLIRRLKLSSLLYPHYMEESESFIYDQRIEFNNKPIYLDGYWQNLKYFEQHRDVLNQLFTPKIEMSEQYLEYLTHIRSTQSVSIHVRRGDYVNDSHTQSVHSVCDLNYYTKAIEYIENKVDNPTYFVFSDDIDWCEENLGSLKNKVFIKNTHSALEDFQLMRNCQSNIIANSTFSWWAAWLGCKLTSDLALKNYVVFPSRWLSNTLTHQLNLSFYDVKSI